MLPALPSPQPPLPTRYLTGFVRQVQDEVGVAVSCPPLDAGQQVDHGTARVTQQRLVLSVLHDDKHGAAVAAATATVTAAVTTATAAAAAAVAAAVVAGAYVANSHPKSDTRTQEKGRSRDKSS